MAVSGVAATTSARPNLDAVVDTVRRGWRRDLLWPTLFALANAVAFLIVRPGVNDLWAARARADAVGHGVGLTYWFAWFSGGTTPASYSILSPYLTWLITPELALALATVATTVLTVVLLRGTARPEAAAAVATIGICVNLWQGRVPFMLAAAFAVASLLAIRHRRVVLATVTAVVSLLFSPVAAAFLGLVLVALLLVKQVDRHTFALPAAGLIIGAGAIVLIFGAPGPDPISVGLTFGMLGALAALLLVWPPRTVRMVIYLSMAVVIALVLIPNGMGSNFARFVWYCLPAAVVARTAGRRVLLTLVTTSLIIVGGVGLVIDLHQASLPASSTNYYASLKAELATASTTAGYPDLKNYRLEVASDGTHTADFALLNNVQLARGWETQTDLQLNPSVRDKNNRVAIPSATYQAWLLHNAVGYVALNRKPPQVTSEGELVSSPQPYLDRIWEDDQWALYRVVNPQPIADPPVKIVGFAQNSLQLDVSCACTFVVRVYWSPNLAARNFDPNEPNATVAEDLPAVPNPNDPKNWTQVTTRVGGLYTLTG